METIKVVGTGPGAKEYLSPIGLEAIRKAETLVGGQRLLDTFASEGQEQIAIKKDLPSIVSTLDAMRTHKRITVLVSGDTGIFSFANYLTKHFQPIDLEFIPGISSVQVMFARLQKPWVDAQIISMHGRTQEGLANIVKGAKRTALVTGNPWTPQKIALLLIEHEEEQAISNESKNIGNWQVAIGKNLTYENELVINTTIEALIEDGNDYSNSVMVITNETLEI